jgi:hypothetical protein
MSTLTGTSRAVVVGSGPTTLSNTPPSAAPACWDNSAAYFDTWYRGLGGITGTTGCSYPTGYQWADSNLGYVDLLTVNNTWDLRLIPAGNTFVIDGAHVTLPMDAIQSHIAFSLAQQLPIAVSFSNEVKLDLTVSRSIGPSVLFRIDSLSNYPTAGERTRLTIATGAPFAFLEVSGLLLTTAGAVSIDITPTMASMTVAGNSLSLPWTPTAADPTTVTTYIEIQATIDDEEGVYSAFAETIGPMQITSPYGNCMTVDRC